VGGLSGPFAFKPDVIPVFGYIDDLVIVPLGILLAVRLVPAWLMAKFRDQATRQDICPVSHAGLVAIIILWLIAAFILIWLALSLFI
jgi:hypothetical protein